MVKVEDRKQSLVPKKKFSFSKRSKLLTTQNTAAQNVSSTNQQEPVVPASTDILNFRYSPSRLLDLRLHVS